MKEVICTIIAILAVVVAADISVADLKKEIDSLKMKVAKQEDHIEKLATDRMVRGTTHSFIPSAFYAYISHSFGNIAAHTDLVYDTVITDVGGEYNRHTGVFTAAESGIYAFTWNILVSGRYPVNDNYGEVSVEIMQNGVNRGTIHADTELSNDDDAATGFVILSVDRGDAVYLRTSTYAHNQGNFVSTASHGRWSFAGFRIA